MAEPVSCLPLLRNTSSCSEQFFFFLHNGERYPTSIIVHANGGVTFHSPRLCTCMLPGRGLCSPPTSVIQHMCFSLLDSSGSSVFAFHVNYRTFPPRRGPRWCHACAVFKLTSDTLATDKRRPALPQPHKLGSVQP